MQNSGHVSTSPDLQTVSERDRSGMRWRQEWTYVVIVLAAAAFWALPVALSSNLLNDDAELVSVVQGWQLSYDTSQPPLYGWVWLAVSKVLGVSIVSTQLLRTVVLALLFCVIFRLGTRVTKHAAAPYLLVSAYVFFPIIAWESTHYQAHTPFANLMTITSLLLVTEIRRRPRFGYFVLLGLVCGLGLLAKYTFVAILGSLFVAALLVKEYRTALFRPVALIAPCIMLLVAAPHAIDLLLNIGGVSHLPTITQELVDEETPFALRGLLGAVGLVQQYVLQSLVFVLVIAALWGVALPRAHLRAALSNADFRFFAIQAAAGFTLTLAAIVGLGLSGISAHHPAPLLLSLPIVVVLAADSSTLLAGNWKWREYAFVGGAVVGVVAIWAILFWSLLSVFPKFFPSYEAVAHAIRAYAGPEAVVIAERYRISGPLRVHEPDFETHALDMAGRVQLPPDSKRPGGCVAVWWGEGAPPSDLVSYAEQITRQKWPEPGTNAIVVANSNDGRAEPAASRIEPLPGGGICATATEVPKGQN